MSVESGQASAWRAGADRLLLARRVERTALVAVLLCFFTLGYFGAAASVRPGEARSLLVPLDRRIPFVAGSIYVYVSVYFAMLLPLFVVRSQAILRRTALGYGIAMGVAFACFLLFPVSSLTLRADLDGLAPEGFTVWGMRTLYALDPPYNLFPSLHLAIAGLAAISVRKTGVRWWPLPALWVLAIAVSVCTVKQHYLVDALAGLALAAASDAVARRPFEASRTSPGALAYSWRGPAAYLAIVALGYAACYAAFRLELAPWTWGLRDAWPR